MKQGISYIILLAMGVMAGACSHKVTEKTMTVENYAQPSQLVYKMSGDYASLVPVTLDSKGNLQSYPDPVDITETQKPVALGNGWYLDRRGISENTAFLDYTYEEYHALPKVPSQETLKAHIKVKRGIRCIWNCGKQSRSIDEYRKLATSGFPGCTCIMPDLTVEQ